MMATGSKFLGRGEGDSFRMTLEDRTAITSCRKIEDKKSAIGLELERMGAKTIILILFSVNIKF